MKIQQLILLCLVLCVSVSVSALDYDKYKKRKAHQQKSVLSAAKKAAKDWDFDKAEKLLKQAQNMTYSPDKVDDIKELISQQRSAKSEQERKAREAKKREYAAQQRRQQSRNASSSSSSGGCSHFVSFSFDGPGPEYRARIQMNSPSGTYVNGNGSDQVSVGANTSSGCIGGRYSFTYSNNASWTGGSDHRGYSGSFSIAPSASYCSVTISDGFGVEVSVYCN